MSTAEEGCCRPPTRWPFSDQTGWFREWGGRRGRLWGSKREPGTSVCKAQRGRLWGEGEEQLGTGDGPASFDFKAGKTRPALCAVDERRLRRRHG